MESVIYHLESDWNVHITDVKSSSLFLVNFKLKREQNKQLKTCQ